MKTLGNILRTATFGVIFGLASLIPKRLDAQDSTYIKAMLNPFSQPRATTIYYGSGDVDSSGSVDQADLDAMNAGVQNDMADVDGDGVASTTLDKQSLTAYLNGETEYLQGHWNKLKTREERSDWVKKMLAIDKTDTLHYIPGEWTSGDYNIKLYFNSNGIILNPNIEPIPAKYDTTMMGRFNLPIYRAGVWHPVENPTWAHGMNAVLTGDNPLNFDEWGFVEPQNDSTNVQPGTWDIPYDSKIVIHGISHFTGSGTVFPFAITGFEIDSTGNPDLIIMDTLGIKLPHPDLVLSRDSLSVVTREPILPVGYSLEQNYPNPFNPRTIIEYSLPMKGPVLLNVYDIRGRKLETLVNGTQDPGKYKVEFDASQYSSGILFYRLISEDFAKTRKMTLIK